MTHMQDRYNKNTKRLYMAFELSDKNWKIMFSNGSKRRQVNIDAGDLKKLQFQIDKARTHLKLTNDTPIFSCYEAGRDGFWLHRYLQENDITNIVVDPASIEVNRRHRRAKTDRIDVIKLTNMLIRYYNGERKTWSIVRVPTVKQEDVRRLDREEDRLKKEKTAHTNRIKSLLVLHGIRIKIGGDFIKLFEKLVQYDGNALPIHLRQEIIREHRRYELVKKQLIEIQQEMKQIRESKNELSQKINRLAMLKGIGPVSSWNLTVEFFGWRTFKNVKQVGAASGLAPTPYQSGNSKIELGISKAGNRRVRTTMIEIAWLWVRFQPQSHLSQWFAQRFAENGKRMRRVGIVALARKLLIAFWKYLEQGLVPQGAILTKTV